MPATTRIYTATALEGSAATADPDDRQRACDPIYWTGSEVTDPAEVMAMLPRVVETK